MREEERAPPSSVRDPFAPPSKPAPRQEKPKRDFSRLKRPLRLVAACVVAAGLGAAAWKLWPSQTDPLPVPAAAIPGSVNSIEKRPIRAKAKGGPEAFISKYATACGGADVFAIALHGDAFYAPEALAEIIHDKKDTQRALLCGAAIEQANFGKATYTLHFDEPSDASIELVRLGSDAETFGSALRRNPPRGLSSLWCAEGHGQDSCGRVPAIGKPSALDFWALGDGAALEEFGDAFQGKSKADAKQVVAWGNLSRAVKSYEVTEIGNPKAPFYFEPFDILDDRAPDTSTARRAFETKVADLGAYWATGGPFDEEGEMRLEIIASSPGEAKDILDALKDLRIAIRHSEGRSQIEGTSARRAYWDSYVAMEKRALVDAEPTIDASTVRMVLNLVAKKEEREAFNAYFEERAKHDQEAVHLVRALQNGDTPTDDNLRAIGGADLWRALEHYGGHEDPAERKDAPASVEVAEMPGLVLPGGGTIETHTAHRVEDVFHVSSGDAAAVVNEAKHLLRDQGWTVAPVTFTGGIAYRCTKDERTVRLLVLWLSSALRLEVND